MDASDLFESVRQMSIRITELESENRGLKNRIRELESECEPVYKTIYKTILDTILQYRDDRIESVLCIGFVSISIEPKTKRAIVYALNPYILIENPYFWNIITKAVEDKTGFTLSIGVFRPNLVDDETDQDVDISREVLEYLKVIGPENVTKEPSYL